MTQTLVLGSTGCIGNNVVRACLDAGWAVRAFHRSASQTWMLDSLDVEHAIGDLNDPASLVAAMRGNDVVFHTAAYYPRHSLDMAGSLREAVSGMRNVLRAAAEAQVGRLVYTSTLTTLGPPEDPDRLADERIIFVDIHARAIQGFFNICIHRGESVSPIINPSLPLPKEAQ